MSFKELNLHPSLLKAVEEAGFEKPTPIQERAIPHVLAGKDLMASAQTGTGKTAAFMLPALHKVLTGQNRKGRGPLVLVLTPTRELATQIAQATRIYGKHAPHIKTVYILGGVSYGAQAHQLARPFDILVATPGRLIDYLERGTIRFDRLETLILDEADRMLDMGFIDAVEHIVKALPTERQTLMFSATLKGNVTSLARTMLQDPLEVHITAAKNRCENIEQRLHYVDDLQHKNKLLFHVLEDTTINQTIVFTATKRHADKLVISLCGRGHQAAALHGDMSQRERTRTMAQFSRGDVRVLVATDVAARGIDIPGISHVINFDLPQSSEDYVHRIGRTGRAGASGIALSFASSKDIGMVEKIERYTGYRFVPATVPGLEPKFQPSSQAHTPSRYNRNSAYGRRPVRRSYQYARP